MKRILIVEDDPLVARVYSTKYASAGFETSIATDGQMGLDLLKTFKPDLVHLDLLVPKVNGVEIVKHIRSHPELATLPVVVLSNTYQNHLVKAVMAAGATELVSKATCTPKMMLEIVEKLRARSKAEPRVKATPATREASPAASLLLAPSPGAEGSPSPILSDAERHAAFQASVLRDFLGRAPELLGELRARVEPLLRAESKEARVSQLAELSRVAHSFSGLAGAAGLRDLSQFSSALVALLRELAERPNEVTDSALRTIVDACDSLTTRVGHAADPLTGQVSPWVVLAVDDEVISRRAVFGALDRLQVATVLSDDPQAALRLLAENRFSLILLDVDMPGLNGFELCRQLRSRPTNRDTPVIFVSSLTGPESREQALASGGNDLITKPFLPMELALKALSLLQRKGARGASEGDPPIARDAELLRLRGELEAARAAARKAEHELPQLARAVEQSPASIVITDRDGNIEYVNAYFEQATGYTKAEVLGKNPRILKSGVTQPHTYGELWRTISAGGEWRGEMCNRRKNGELYWEYASISGLKNEIGQISHYIAVKDDITERKRTEESLRVSLREKEALLQETHHRVKNNLALIVSLMRLTGGRSREAETKAVLQEMQTRIQSVILLNETLYKTARYSRVNLADYVKQIATQDFKAQNDRAGLVRLVFDVQPVEVATAQAIPCGLIVNELVTNSLKHAFPDGKAGEVAVDLRSNDDGDILLRVSDTGVGLPDDFRARQAASLGMQLVMDLVKQLHGTLEVGPGASFKITFPSRGPDTGTIPRPQSVGT